MSDPISSPELQPWFWELLESSGRNLRTLCRKLEALPRERLLEYRENYDAAKECINPCYADEYLAHLADCSEDHADDFAAWAVSQGREFYAQVRAQPARIGEFFEMFEACEAGEGFPGLRWDEEVDRKEYKGYQRADYIADPIFESRFGEELEDALEEWLAQREAGDD
jgi:hypothetical protein